ncbi:MAG: aspartate--tRNA ligase [Bacteroidetes Order II. Incertae sedis bacterium]|jgi:aspartyl-tRNA synthetase|nr:aspartate--tRNA ligase [Bacteroidetes Order II. bacterium]MDG1754835.1 aspartate--tRNA ligase [Rhodothermales bacterium]HAY35679.1 aspartate--tRNA ligase [Bacteroidota bacterium]MBT4603247.1 aspartate--tRNA ligase [Bacteroidetes Order II. bacterium]MBT5249356.1 aspartate--tRNA ligase [Bacteroidetes Order II. bacterium]
MSVSQFQIDSHGQRTHTCGALRAEHIGQDIVLKGWVDTRRDLGGLIFVDLRDRYGITQIVFNPQDFPDATRVAEDLRYEFVITVKGKAKAREVEARNTDLPTAAIEVMVEDVIVLNSADPLPFMVSVHEGKQTNASDDLRLKYRYLDLRRNELKNNVLLRHRVYQSVRRFYDGQDFVEVETPVLMKSTPEGARDYLVPSRVHAGKFFALPQSPQTYKQILMVSGFDRYFQIVKCFRDEDLRADRQPEFTQIDVEMTFATEDSIYATAEGMLASIWKDVKGVDLELPFPRMSYDAAIRTYGSDKPDLRFDMKLHDLSPSFEGCGFRVFDSVIAEGGAVVGIVIPGGGDTGRGKLDKLDKDFVRKKLGAGGLMHFRLPSDGSEVLSSVKAEVLPTEFVQKALDQSGASKGDLLLVLAGAAPKVFEQVGDLRLKMGRDLGLISDNAEGPWNFLWVTDFPLLEYDEDAGRYHAMHHPFTSPAAADMDKLGTDPGAVRAQAYDIVLNGSEIGGGSIRIHRPEVQSQMFDALGIGEEEAQARFGFLLDAFRFGAPPHGGIAFGLDRIVMLLTGASSLRDVIVFPKTQSAQEPMVQSPDIVDDHQLNDLHIQLIPTEDDE